MTSNVKTIQHEASNEFAVLSRPHQPSRSVFVRLVCCCPSSIHLRNSCRIRTSKKRGRGTPSNHALPRPFLCSRLHARFQQLPRNQLFEPSLLRNTRVAPQFPRFEHPRISDEDIRPDRAARRLPASRERNPIAISLLLLRVLSSSQSAAKRRLAVCSASTSRKNGWQAADRHDIGR